VRRDGARAFSFSLRVQAGRRAGPRVRGTRRAGRRSGRGHAECAWWARPRSAAPRSTSCRTRRSSDRVEFHYGHPEQSACAKLFRVPLNNDGVRIRLIDPAQRPRRRIFAFAGGGARLSSSTSTRTRQLACTRNVFYALDESTTTPGAPPFLVEVAMQWNDGYVEKPCSRSRTTSPQKDGGNAHHRACGRRWTRVLNKYNRGKKRIRQGAPKVETNRRRTCAKGLTCVPQREKVPEPKFSSQTKDKLVSLRGQGPRSRRCWGRAAGVVSCWSGRPMRRSSAARFVDAAAAAPRKRPGVRAR